MNTAERLHQAHLALLTARRALASRKHKSTADTERLQRLEAEFKRAMEAYLGRTEAEIRAALQAERDGVHAEYKAWSCWSTLGDACPTYTERNTTMPPTQSPSVAREGDILDTAIDAADLRMSEADQVYDRWKSKGLTSALALVATFKAAPGMQTIEVPAELAGEIAACRAQWGDTPFAKMLRQARGDQTTTSVPLADDEKASARRYKSAEEARLAQTATIFTDDGRPLFRPIWDPKTGKLLE